MRYTKKQFEAEYPNNDACLESVFQNRFGDLKYCPRCGAETKFYRVKKRQCYACMHCAYQLYPLAGTIFRKTTTPLKDWFYAIYLFSVSKNGVSAKELERHLGVTYKTAWRMCKQIRLLMQQDADILSGEVEADETYVGGKHFNKQRYSSKTPVMGIVEKGGIARAEVTDRATRSKAMSFLKTNVEAGTVLHTDESRIYVWAKEEYEHEVVNHGAKQYSRFDRDSRRNVNTNTIEGFWSQLRRSIDGTYHVVSPKYLQSYVNEFVFRYNYRGVAVGPVLLELAGKRI